MIGLKEGQLVYFAPSDLELEKVLELATRVTNSRIKSNEVSTSTFGYFGTISWVGTLEDQPGQWTCIEWDEPDRGRNSGSFKDKRIILPKLNFVRSQAHITNQTVSPDSYNPCSFLKIEKAMPHCYEGTTLIKALKWRYQSSPSTSQDVYVEKSNGKQVKVVFEGQIQAEEHFRNFSQLSYLEVDSALVSSVGSREEWNSLGEMKTKKIKLETSHMLNDWNDLIEILDFLPSLQSLLLPHCWRLGYLTGKVTSPLQRRSIESLDLTGIPLTWDFIEQISLLFDKIEYLNFSRCGLDSLPNRGLRILNEVKKIQLDRNFQILKNPDQYQFFDHSRMPNLVGFSVHETAYRPSIAPDNRYPNILELGMDGICIDSWKELFLLGHQYPNLQKLSMVQTKLEISNHYELEDEKLWEQAHLWKITRSCVIQLIVGLIFPKLELYNFKSISDANRQEAYKYIVALMKRYHPLIEISPTNGYRFDELEDIKQILHLWDSNTECGNETQEGMSKTAHILIEPDVANFDECFESLKYQLVPVKIRVSTHMTIGQLLELYIRKQIPKALRSLDDLDLYPKDGKAERLDKQMKVGNWLENCGLVNDTELLVLHICPVSVGVVSEINNNVGIRHTLIG